MNEIAILDVFLNQTKIGYLTRLPGDRIQFHFSEAYIEDSQRPTLSQSCFNKLGELLVDMPSTQTKAPPFLSNLLPEGRKRLRKNPSKTLPHKYQPTPASQPRTRGAAGRPAATEAQTPSHSNNIVC